MKKNQRLYFPRYHLKSKFALCHFEQQTNLSSFSALDPWIRCYQGKKYKSQTLSNSNLKKKKFRFSFDN